MSLTKEEVISYYNDRMDIYKLHEFLERYVVEVRNAKWNPMFMNMMTDEILSNVFDELFRELDIHRVEEISTGVILKLY